MKKYIIGFIVGLSTAATMVYALDYSDIDWSEAHKDEAFTQAVQKVVSNKCTVSGSYIYC